MNAQDSRWIQRLTHFSKALRQLTKFVEKGNLSELEEQGLIQSFEYNYELAWNMLKDYFEAQGDTNINGSRDAFRLAFKRDLLQDGEIWMEMVQSRTMTTHTYNKDIADEIAANIVNRYFSEFEKLKNTMDTLKEETP